MPPGPASPGGREGPWPPPHRGGPKEVPRRRQWRALSRRSRSNTCRAATEDGRAPPVAGITCGAASGQRGI
eukprot:11164034-Lingulodinium_polyedra.AAC.1